MPAESEIKQMQNASDCCMEVECYHGGRGEYRAQDINISRPAGIVSARENNSSGITVFRGQERLRRVNVR